MAELIWKKSPQIRTLLDEFKSIVQQRYTLDFKNDEQLFNQWTVENAPIFWDELWDFAGFRGTKGDKIVERADHMMNDRWFPNAKVNYAENLLKYEGPTEAIVSYKETGVKTVISWDELKLQVGSVANYLKNLGVQKGDIVAAYMPNCAENTIAMLAVTSLGAIWSSCSPDFGVSGVTDRFSQIEPKIWITVDGYHYNGKSINLKEKHEEILKIVTSIEKTIVVPFLDSKQEILENVILWEQLLEAKTANLTFERVPFNHPLFIMFSSGTTGKPKCIVHGVGGTLLQHYKEHKLHANIQPNHRFFYYTTCGWMMWNWLMSGLASGATLILFDGSPFTPEPSVLIDLIDREKITHFGTSAKYIVAIEKADLIPKDSHKLDSLTTIFSTGSPLSYASYDYVYHKIKKEVCLASISGGTDIISCFVLGNYNMPVYRGEIQTSGFGMAVDIWNEEGKSVTGEKGELVCIASFPSMPVFFWNDKDNTRYKSAYFDHFENVWTHGDYAERTVRGTYLIHGRSDTVLNPGGVRIGTAEIYRQVEKIDWIMNSVVIGQRWENDVRVVLFVVTRDNQSLTEEKIQYVKNTIRQNATPRHTPSKIIAVADIPKTVSGKIVELAIQKVVHNEEVKNKSALANPEALKLFENIPELN